MAQISFSDLVNGVVPDASDFNDRYNTLKNRINNGMEQDNLAAGSVTSAKIVAKNVTGLKLGDDVVSAQTLVTGDLTDHILIADVSDGGNVKKALASDFTPDLTGHVVQVVNYQTGAAANGTTAMPFDDTIPQNNEGDEFMTLAITPKSATNKLKIDVVLVYHEANGTPVCALFQDTTAGALAATKMQHSAAGEGGILNLTHYMTAGTSSETTFKVRAGDSTTLKFNSGASGRLLGGVLASSITITEIKDS